MISTPFTMKLLFFYNDLFGSGGIPGEFRAIVSSLATHAEITVATKPGPNRGGIPEHVSVTLFRDRHEVKLALRKLFTGHHFDAVILAEYFSLYALPVAKAAESAKIPVVLYPTNQINRTVFEKDLFQASPDVRSLERRSSQHSQPNARLKLLINQVKKRGFKSLIGDRVVARTSCFAVLSQYEQEEIAKVYPEAKDRFILLPWVNPLLGMETHHDPFFSKTLDVTGGKRNFVYWGRLDYWMKGLDRILQGVKWVSENIEQIPFRVYLIGPDYHGGQAKVEREINRLGLQDSVSILPPGKYPAGSKAPLRDADASILMSRWDGLPRSIRESLLLNVPVIASKETHTSDVFKSGRGGLTLEDADDAKEVGRALLRIQDAEFKDSTHAASEFFDPDVVADRFFSQLSSKGIG